MASNFVGRRQELDLLEQRLRSVRAGSGSRTVVIEGVAGVGKSALLAAFTDALTDVHSLIVSGDEAEAGLELGLCRQLLGTVGRDWPDSFAAGAALLRLVDDQPDDHVVVIVVDDAHLADLASLRALTFALRRLTSHQVLTVASVRSESLRQLPSGLLQLADRHDGHLILSGLSEDEVIELAVAQGGDRPSRRLAGQLLEDTRGNPLYLKILLSEYPVARLQSAPSRLPPPRSFERLVCDWLEALSPSTQRMAHAAAVLGEGAMVEHLSVVAGIAEVTEALEDLQRTGIMRLRSSPPSWRVEFEHPLIRIAVYEAAGPATRAELHTRAAEILTGPRVLNHLVAAATKPDAELAAALERQSGDLKRAEGLTAAADSMFASARLTDEPMLADRRFLDAVELVLMARDIATAFAYSERVDHMPITAHRLSVQSRMAWLSGDLLAAEALAKQAWEMGEGLDPAARDALAAMLSQLLIMRDQGAESVVWATEALNSGRLSAEQAGATRAAAASGLMISGRAEEGHALLADLDPDPAKIPPERHRELRARGIIRLVTDDLSGARADLEVCSSVAGRDLSPSRLTAIAALAETEYRLGHWDASLALIEQSLSLIEDTEQFWLQGQIHSMAVLIRAGRGEWTQGEKHLQSAQQMATLLGDPATMAYADNAAIHLAMCRGDPRAVLRAADRLVNSDHGGPHEPGVMAWPVHRVASLVEVGRYQDAKEALAELEHVARERGRKSRLAALARVRGELCGHLRELTQARMAFEYALTIGTDTVDALERAMGQASYGRFLRRRGERRSAVAHLQLAYDGFLALRAAPFLARTEGELLATGLTPRQGSADDSANLTPQEHVVARLVCMGRSNREVADELVLSVKTVSYHLSNVYTKLDIHSRAQLINHPAMRRQ